MREGGNESERGLGPSPGRGAPPVTGTTTQRRKVNTDIYTDLRPSEKVRPQWRDFS